MSKVGFFPGTFDPLTNGHLDIIRRSFCFVDYLYIGIGINRAKKPLLPLDVRLKLVKEEVQGIFQPSKNIEARGSVLIFKDLMIHEARRLGASIILRGIRNQADYAYEVQMALVSQHLEPNIETVFLPSSVDGTIISSSMVREMALMGASVASFVPPAVEPALHEFARGLGAQFEG